MALLKNQTILDQDVPIAEKSSSATSSAGSIKDGGFTQSIAPSLYQMDPHIPKASSGKFTQARDQINYVGSEH